jgi:hypothetical protein
VGKKDAVKAYGAFSFLNGEDGVWFKRDGNDGGGKSSKGSRKTAKRTNTRTKAIASTEGRDGPLEPSPFRYRSSSLPSIQHGLGSQSLFESRLGSQAMMPRPRLGVMGPSSKGGVGLMRPFVRGSLFALEPEPKCNGAEEFIVLALAFMLTVVGFKSFRRLQTTRGLREPLMDA